MPKIVLGRRQCVHCLDCNRTLIKGLSNMIKITLDCIHNLTNDIIPQNVQKTQINSWKSLGWDIHIVNKAMLLQEEQWCLVRFIVRFTTFCKSSKDREWLNKRSWSDEIQLNGTFAKMFMKEFFPRVKAFHPYSHIQVKLRIFTELYFLGNYHINKSLCSKRLSITKSVYRISAFYWSTRL